MKENNSNPKNGICFLIAMRMLISNQTLFKKYFLFRRKCLLKVVKKQDQSINIHQNYTFVLNFEQSSIQNKPYKLSKQRQKDCVIPFLNRTSLFWLSWSFHFGLFKATLYCFQVFSSPFNTKHICNKKRIERCVKSVQIGSVFWSVFSCIQTEYRKIRSRKTPYLEDFHAVEAIKQQVVFEMFFQLCVGNMLCVDNTIVSIS